MGWNAFAEHGTVTDAYNPGRGFAFVTFASAEDAQKAMNALEGQEVCGREIQCNVAKPREQKDGGGRGGRGGARGGGRGGRGGRGGGINAEYMGPQISVRPSYGRLSAQPPSIQAEALSLRVRSS